MLPKRRKSSSAKPESPLDARMREVAEREARILAETEQCHKVIKEAPERAEKIAQARREEIRTRATRTETRRGNPVTLPDRWRMQVNVAAPAQHKRMRKERRQGRWLFFLLLLVLVGASYCLYYAVSHS